MLPPALGCSRHPSLPPCACHFSLLSCFPRSGSLLPGTAWLGKEPDSSQPHSSRCQREQPHPIALDQWKEGDAALDLSPCALVARGSWQGRSAIPAMPHFLDWFVPVYLMISILILVGFGACIYYFEPGLQEAHKWRTQRPIVERDLRKTLMIRDNLAFGVPEV
ncbi:protein SMIM45 [Cuculus canorus]|nr:protein SMIM45 [Cuculus canorus]